MKKCPYCAEEIQEEAIKCRFCGEMLDSFKDSNKPQRVIDIHKTIGKKLMLAGFLMMICGIIGCSVGLNILQSNKGSGFGNIVGSIGPLLVLIGFFVTVAGRFLE